MLNVFITFSETWRLNIQGQLDQGKMRIVSPADNTNVSNSDLMPNTEYLVSVVCVYEDRVSQAVTGVQKTSKSLKRFNGFLSL